jgi:predicted RNA methylase
MALDLGKVCQFETDVQGRPLLVCQLPNSFIGGCLWDCGLFLAQHIQYTTYFVDDYFRGKSIVELGCGTGIVGLTCSMLGGDVTLTDLDEVVPLINHTVALNKLENNVLIKIFPYASDVSILQPPYEIILLADVIYSCSEEDHAADIEALQMYRDLCRSLEELSNYETTVILCYKNRSHPSEAAFFRMLRRSFVVLKESTHGTPFGPVSVIHFRKSKLLYEERRRQQEKSLFRRRLSHSSLSIFSPSL